MIDRAIRTGIVTALEQQKGLLYGDDTSLLIGMAILGINDVPKDHRLSQELHYFLTKYFGKLGWCVSENVNVNEESQHIILRLQKISTAQLYF